MGWSGRMWLLVACALATGPVSSSSAVAQEPLTYVALGDSYTSGPLVPPFTEQPYDCGRSDLNYPHLVAQALPAGVFRDVSCGSATIDDFYEPQDGLPAGGTNPAQFDALGPDVDVVTVGIAGNDVGFTGLALDCVRLMGPPSEQPCTPPADEDPFPDELADAAEELAEALRDIHELAPNAEVFVVSYPTSLPDDAVACWPYVPILQADMPYLVTSFKAMNAMLAEQAAANDATYVDIYTPSIGHDVCKPPGIAWVNGVVVVPPSYPAHPNNLSYLNSAPVVTAAIKARMQAASPSPSPSPITTTEPAPTATTTSQAVLPIAGPGRSGGVLSVTGVLPVTGDSPAVGIDAAALVLVGLAGRAALTRRRG